MYIFSDFSSLSFFCVLLAISTAQWRRVWEKMRASQSRSQARMLYGEATMMWMRKKKARLGSAEAFYAKSRRCRQHDWQHIKPAMGKLGSLCISSTEHDSNFSAMRCWRFARCKCQKHTSKTQCEVSCKQLRHSRRSIVLLPNIIEFHMTFMLSFQLDIHICSL